MPSVGATSNVRSKYDLDAASLDIARRFEGLQLKEDGSTTVHGSGSFFKLLSRNDHDFQDADITFASTGSKEQLTNSAWIERAREERASVPV